MRRRVKAGYKAQRRKISARRNAPKTTHPRSSRAAGKEPEEVARLTRELKEAREQQMATGEILASITGSITDAKPVFDAIARNLRRLFGTHLAVVQILKDGMVHLAAAGSEREFKLLRKHFPQPVDENTGGGRAMLSKQVLHYVPVLGNSTAPPATQQFARDLDFNSVIFAPMIRGGTVIGALSAARREAKAFDEEEVALIRSFADQAVIAIENVRLFEAERQRTQELSESLEQQTATSEVLKVISSSSGKLDLVFQTMLANATRICNAAFGSMLLIEGDVFRRVALHNAPPMFVKFNKKTPVIPLGQVHDLNLLLETKRPVHIADAAGTADSPIVKYGGARTLVIVPMLKEAEVIGAIGIYRQEVRPFTDKQIDLVTNFAAQAVIAIENGRLLNELRDSLQQQTATADVLKVISSSPGDLGPVFEAMLEKATSICGAKFGTLFLSEGNCARAVAQFRAPPAYAEVLRRGPIITLGEGALGRAARTKQAVQIADVRTDPAYVKDPRRLAILELAGARTMLNVPMLKNNEVVGQIAIYRQEVLPFTDKQIEVVKNFAAQAVIAIENTRLLNELRQRTDDLSEALEQQTATSEVLTVISSSAGELQPVFNTMLAKAIELCDASFGAMWLVDGDGYRTAALHGDLPKTYLEQWRSGTLHRPKAVVPMVRAIRSREPVHVIDMLEDEAYLENDPLARSVVDIAGIRTLLTVPMLKDNEAIGVVTIYRKEVRAFSNKQVDLVSNFAAQAVIAIENTRLLNELRESLQQQTATADVLKVISSSPGDLEPVFNAMLENAVKICDAKFGTMLRVEGDGYRVVAMHGAPMAYAKERRHNSLLRVGPTNPLTRLARSRELEHIADIRTDQAYLDRDLPFVQLADFAGARTLLSVPMLKENNFVGAIVIYRQEVRPFTDKQAELVKNFAAQAVIAIENARLLNELRQRTDDLATSLDNLRTTQDRLVQTQKLASLGQLTAGIAHEIKNPLNFVNNFSGLSAELIDELQQALNDGDFNETRRSELTELMITLKSNLDKVVQHGKRADAIVKNMLLHSHQGSGEHRPVAINTIVEESLKLAYHGARAEKQNFNIMVEQSFDPVAGEADIFPQEITRVLLNLISNGVYATRDKTSPDGRIYRPTLTASTKDLGDRVEIKIRDNGIGIPPEVKEKMFNPFFTTKPPGEGTGLGLSISHDIVVKQHGGSIEVDTQPGEFTEVRIVLPRTAASISG